MSNNIDKIKTSPQIMELYKCIKRELIEKNLINISDNIENFIKKLLWEEKEEEEKNNISYEEILQNINNLPDWYQKEFALYYFQIFKIFEKEIKKDDKNPESLFERLKYKKIKNNDLGFQILTSHHLNTLLETIEDNTIWEKDLDILFWWIQELKINKNELAEIIKKIKPKSLKKKNIIFYLTNKVNQLFPSREKSKYSESLVLINQLSNNPIIQKVVDCVHKSRIWELKYFLESR